MIAYHYHPDASVGALRTIKFAKYLPQYGWQPHILTTHPRYYRVVDNTPLEFDCPVHRVGKWPLPDDLYRRFRGMFSRKGDDAATAGKTVHTSDLINASKTNQMPAWKRFFHSLSITPDVNAGWFPPAVWKTLRLTRQYRFDAIYTSGPPQTCHLVGLAASKLSGVPWILDFRDPWYEPHRKHPFAQQWWTNFQQRYEARCVRQARKVVTTTDEWRDALMERHNPDLEGKCHSIVNGYDEEDFRSLVSNHQQKKSDEITFLHAGTLYYGRDPYTLLTATGELCREGLFRKGDVLFKFRGIAEIDPKRLNKILDEFELTDAVTIKPPVARTEYFRLLMDSDVLVLFQGLAASVHIPAKAFEYLATGKQILVLTEKGATRQFMSQFDQVAIAGIENKDEIKAAIKKCLDRVRSGQEVSLSDPRMSAITKLKLTGKFADLLDSVVSTSPDSTTRIEASAIQK